MPTCMYDVSCSIYIRIYISHPRSILVYVVMYVLGPGKRSLFKHIWLLPKCPRSKLFSFI